MNKNYIKLISWSSALILLILVIFIMDQYSKKSEPNLENENQKIFNFQNPVNQTHFSQIVLNTQSEPLLLKPKNQQPNSWTVQKKTSKLKNPKNYPVDSQALQSLVNDFTQITSLKSFPSKNLQNYGLLNSQNPETFVFSLSTKSTKSTNSQKNPKENPKLKQYTLVKGNQAPDGNYYARKGDQFNTVYLVSEYDLDQNLKKSIKDLRNKNFLNIQNNTENQILSLKIQNTKTQTLNILKTKISSAPLKTLPKNLSQKQLSQNQLQYDPKTQSLSFRDTMTEDQKKSLSILSTDPAFQKTIQKLFDLSQKEKWTLQNTPQSNVNLEKTKVLINDILNIKAIDFPLNLSPQNQIQIQIQFQNQNAAKLLIWKLNQKTYAQYQNEIYEIPSYLFDSFNKSKNDLLIQKPKNNP